ncbi:hypothetical protein [Microbulbifer sp. GL-2]|uniref:hypothetical protein n=1 Tax=Microbulbifer sp. GL-2 TaxID=2591606 RepID=UPI0011644E05|nr:hypothetical protein [Microbulbifer sp. GL-2]BBM03574.1 hypothetical protein GL2_36480 [Microbulbifer sp. GL-2]
MNMKKTKFAFFLLPLFVAPNFSGASSCPEPVKENMTVEREKKIYSLVQTYVSDVKGWPDDSFCVELNRQEGGVIVFWVIHKDDKASLIPGGGKSIEVYVDQKEMKIIKELAFQ